MNLIHIIKKLGLIDTECAVCKKENYFIDQGYICEECINNIKPYHPIEYEHIEYLFSYRIFGIYEGVLMHTIKSIKFHLNKPLARILGEIIKPYLWDYIHQVKPDYVTFPPLNYRRIWQRGFNHAELILKHAGVTPIKLFIRRGFSKPMALLSKEEREKAVREFDLRKESLDLIENKVILIFDDLITSGTTVSYLAKLLLMAGASQVHAFFIAKAI